ncbi:hypothetical protein COMNV_00444 [Commensalibacter sp. Nvir]|uniref:BRO-N domain-containing protein n=1 Tax=Commensalibacter sp. Nvir TaxID=3069817 RepID=UPI002D2F3572|nr:hypothetical protein COMNV_00444 [Commensalibacter sp. Nvir]
MNTITNFNQISNSILSFNFDNANVRVIDKNNEPWFVLKDICNVLDISKYRDASSRLDDDERGSVRLDTPGGKQEITVINESGLYSLILRSQKPEAKRFKKWVTAEVLPSIRKTGSYSISLSENNVIKPNQLGGIIKGIVNKSLLPIKEQFETQIKILCKEIQFLKSSYDPTAAFVTDYKPMIAILKDMKIPQHGRRALVCRCSSKCRKYLLSVGKGNWVKPSRETGRWVYHIDGINEWLKYEGHRIISYHIDKVMGQTCLQLVPSSR